jgi:CRISPR/Cas system-associated protein endoribonuclease Cas2
VIHTVCENDLTHSSEKHEQNFQDNFMRMLVFIEPTRRKQKRRIYSQLKQIRLADEVLLALYPIESRCPPYSTMTYRLFEVEAFESDYISC